MNYEDANKYFDDNTISKIRFLRDFSNQNRQKAIAGGIVSEMDDDLIQYWMADTPNLWNKFFVFASDNYLSFYAVWTEKCESRFGIVYLEKNSNGVKMVSASIDEFLSLLCIGAKEIGVEISEESIISNTITEQFRKLCSETYNISAPSDFGKAIKERAARECPDVWQWILENGVESE